MNYIQQVHLTSIRNFLSKVGRITSVDAVFLSVIYRISRVVGQQKHEVEVCRVKTETGLMYIVWLRVLLKQGETVCAPKTASYHGKDVSHLQNLSSACCSEIVIYRQINDFYHRLASMLKPALCFQGRVFWAVNNNLVTTTTTTQTQQIIRSPKSPDARLSRVRLRNRDLSQDSTSRYSHTHTPASAHTSTPALTNTHLGCRPQIKVKNNTDESFCHGM